MVYKSEEISTEEDAFGTGSTVTFSERIERK
jgi:hypothetical protein